MIPSKLLTSAALLAAALLAGCGDNSTPGGESSTPGPGERAGKAVDNATQKAQESLHDAAIRLADMTATDKTADTTAAQLIDSARASLKSNDIAQAKAVLAQLKDKGAYDKLSPATKTRVDDLERDINAAAAGMPK